jgi:dienelactone hydrolase
MPLRRNGDPLSNPSTVAAFVTALLIANVVECAAAQPEAHATVVELESPLASPLPLEGYLRRTNSPGPSPAVVLLHGCNGNWRRLDQRWGTRIASWGYVTLTVDHFGPRGIKDTCNSGAPVDLAFDAYRALRFLVQQPFADPARVAALGFSQGGWLALTSVEHGAIEQTSPNKFRAAIAFYPPCRGFNGNMTVPTLILIGELDDWTPAAECRNMVDGRDDWGISRQKTEGAPIRLIVYPDAHHGFDAPNLTTPFQFFGHHLEFNQAATDRSIDAVHEFLDTTIGGKEQGK